MSEVPAGTAVIDIKAQDNTKSVFLGLSAPTYRMKQIYLKGTSNNSISSQASSFFVCFESKSPLVCLILGLFYSVQTKKTPSLDNESNY